MNKLFYSFSLLFLFSLFVSTGLKSQINFDYSIELEAKTIDGLQGLHSYAFGQYEGKWILFGGRRDGIHARQPFNAFPASENNTTIYLVDPVANTVLTQPITNLPTTIREQLQSTNMQFYQEETTLYFIGGYGYSTTNEDHITYPYLTAIDLAGLAEAIMDNAPITPFFEQITDDIFAVTGGNVGKVEDVYWLIGGHRFDGRYNPMGHPTFVQTYTNQIRKFRINHENGLAFTDYESITDEVNLHRRDYNLVPQIYPDGTRGYTIFSGVFQYNQDLPYLYPVNIFADEVEPIFDFNQQLCNYHTANIPLYDSLQNRMHTIFFGGISQYYFDADNNLIQDDNVPFVKTISRVSRDAEGHLEEVLLPLEMPGYLGSSAEFIPNPQLPQLDDGIITLNLLEEDRILLGHIFGGIESPAQNPFSFNNSEVTTASPTLFAVYLQKDVSTSYQPLSGYHDFDLTVFPNPTRSGVFNVRMKLPEPGDIEIMLTNMNGTIGMHQILEGFNEQSNQIEVQMEEGQTGVHVLTVVLNGKYFASQKIFIE
jgi:hypothetical protein